MGADLCITPAAPASIAAARCLLSAVALKTRAVARGRESRSSFMRSAPDPSAEVETEAHAGCLATLPVAAPAELLEDPRHVVRVGARPAVGDLQPDATPLGDHPQLDGRPLGRILGGVGEQ